MFPFSKIFKINLKSFRYLASAIRVVVAVTGTLEDIASLACAYASDRLEGNLKTKQNEMKWENIKMGNDFTYS